MGDKAIETIRKEIKKIEKALNKAKEEKKLLPQGHLRCTSSNGTEQFFVDGKYVSKKQTEWIRGIAQREYYEEIIPIMEASLRKLHAVEKLDGSDTIDNCYQSACKTRKKLVTPVFPTREEEIEAFLKEEYAALAFEKENKTEFYTAKGERVRSKSELLISEQLCKYEIPYRYEKPIELWDWSRAIICRPDFTVMNRRTGKVYLYEHLGMMDDPAYVESSMRKLDLYEKNGYLIGKNLIVTRETQDAPLNIGKVNAYIKEFFL